jgi:signal transduction histidine kinase
VLPIAPVMVAVVGITTAVIIAMVGAQQLQRSSDAAAATRSRVLATTVAARLRTTALEDRAAVLNHAARRSGAAIMLVDQSGAVVADESLSALTRGQVVELLVRAEGLEDSSLGRAWFTASPLSPPLEHLSVLTFVRAPAPTEVTMTMLQAVALLTALLLGVALAVAYALIRNARDDVVFVRNRLRGMAEPAAGDTASSTDALAHKPVPIRSLDQVGQLTAALNVLVTRFDAAERTYRADLKHVADLDEERSLFLAGLSHELRTPLNAILGFTHLLESEADGPLTEDAKESLGVIRTSGEHLRTLIDDILDLSAMETGQLRLVRAEVDVRALAEDVVREARVTIQDRPVSLTLDGADQAWLRADPRRLRQVLTNLVSNALKFTARGEVRVAVEATAEEVTLAVSDSGRGIPPELVSTIFRAYRQVSDETDRGAGAGLGLAIARRLVMLHGGTIEVASEVNRGSTFTIRLPLRETTPSPPKAALSEDISEEVSQ